MEDGTSILGEPEVSAQGLDERALSLAREIERLVAELRERTRTVSERERTVGEQHERLSVREADVEQRASRLEELRAQLATLEGRIAHEEKLKAERAGESDELEARKRLLDERQTGLDGRLAEVDATSKKLAEASNLQNGRAAELERVATRLAAQHEELEQRLKAVEARELLVRRLERPAPAPASEPGRTFSIDGLEKLVATQGRDFPDRGIEWEAYLFELREQSGPDGRLPERLTGLIEEVFAPLL